MRSHLRSQQRLKRMTGTIFELRPSLDAGLYQIRQLLMSWKRRRYSNDPWTIAGAPLAIRRQHALVFEAVQSLLDVLPVEADADFATELLKAPALGPNRRQDPGGHGPPRKSRRASSSALSFCFDVKTNRFNVKCVGFNVKCGKVLRTSLSVLFEKTAYKKPRGYRAFRSRFCRWQTHFTFAPDFTLNRRFSLFSVRQHQNGVVSRIHCFYRYLAQSSIFSRYLVCAIDPERCRACF